MKKKLYKVGDRVYCIDNNGVEKDLDIGKGYTIDMVDNRGVIQIFRLVETESRWMGFRFSKNPRDRKILAYFANKVAIKFDM